MKRAKLILPGIAAAVIIAATVLLLVLNRPRELVIAFPEMSSSRKGFIDPLVTLYEIESGTEVSVRFIKNTVWEKDARSEDPSGDVYYSVNNYLLRSLENDGSTFSHRIRGSENVPDVFFRDPGFLPVSWYPWGFFYNKPLFSGIGLEEPESWEDFLEICEAASAEGVPALSLTTKIKWPSAVWFDYLDVMLNGRAFHLEVLSGNVPFNDEAVARVFSEILSLHRKGYVYLDSETFDWEAMAEAVMSKKSLMHLSGSFFQDTIPVDLKEEIGWFPFPSTDTLVASSSGFFLPVNGKNRREARKFMRFTVGRAAQKVIQDNSGLIAVNSAVSADCGKADIKRLSSSVSEYKAIIPSMERNTHPELLVPLKSAVSALYSIPDEQALAEMLDSLEEYRKSVFND